jgi:translation initiation factor IF-3
MYSSHWSPPLQVGEDIFQRFVVDVSEGETELEVVAPPKMEGRQYTMMLAPKKL